MTKYIVATLAIAGLSAVLVVDSIHREKKNLADYEQCKMLTNTRTELVIMGQTVSALEWCFKQFRPNL